MARTVAPLLPQSQDRLAQMGERLRLARRRRKLSAAMVAERAGMSRVTLTAVEKGMPGVTIGSYLAVMQVLGLDAGIDKVAAEDPLGRELQDATLQSASLRFGSAFTRPRLSAVAAQPEQRIKDAARPASTGSRKAAPDAGADEGLGLAATLRQRAKDKLAGK